MNKPPKPLIVRLGELRPVVDAVELTKGLRGKIVGGKKRFANLMPAEGGMMIELFGSSTFVPIGTGALVHALRVDADFLAGFLRNSTRAFHPAEIVSLDIGEDTVVARCGTLRVTLQIGPAPSSPRKDSVPAAVRTATAVRPPEPEDESARAIGIERRPGLPEFPPPQDEGNENSILATAPTEADLRLSAAERELYRVEEIERELHSSKKRRPDCIGVKFLLLGWLTLIAISELVFGGDILAWLVVACACAVLAEAWADQKAQHEWETERWKKKDQIAAALKRIEILGFTARQKPAQRVLKPRDNKSSSED